MLPATMSDEAPFDISLTHTPPPTPPPEPQPNPADADDEPVQSANVKETLESILIAFILAFIFRGFVVEAFVIPTGSMAPTLLGAHMRFRCEDCGWRWDVNFETNGRGDDLVIPSRANRTVNNVRCPNCGYTVQPYSAASQDANNTASSPPVRYGDRILVLKYLYLYAEPRRWDVAV